LTMPGISKPSPDNFELSPTILSGKIFHNPTKGVSTRPRTGVYKGSGSPVLLIFFLENL